MSLLYSEIFESEQGALPITERAIAYGDGVFTTAKISDGKVVDLSKHLERLKVSTDKLAIPYKDTNLAYHLSKLAQQFELAVLKIIVTAGEGGRGYSRVNSCAQKILITVHEYPKHYDTWISAGICVGIADYRLGINPALAGLKHLNRLEQVMLRQELDSRTEDDLLTLNCNGNVVEMTSGNVFWRDLNTSTWLTPALEQSGVNGLIRQKLLSELPDTRVACVDLNALNNVRSMFVCNSVMGIVPVREFNGQLLDISQVHQVQRAFS